MSFWILTLFPNLLIIRHLLSLFFTFRSVNNEKKNKGKEIVDEEDSPETQPQVHPLAGDKKRSMSKNLDLGNLPNWRGKKAKHG